MNNLPRVRFAPSPTGLLHLGLARTALSNFLFAKQHNGKFLVRIEDTDSERSKKKHINQICDTLKWLGLNWDEELTYQSENSLTYNKFIKKLLDSDKAYRCFATKDELDSIREDSNSYHYTGIWRDREKKDIDEEINKGTSFTIRLKTPIDGIIQYNDLIYGNITISNTELDDFILFRSDGSPVYNFTNVIDDYIMGITHVIRGEDHIPNTPKQILIYNALGFDTPEFAHLPMILGEDKKKLSKRHGATGVDEYRQLGYQPAALLNYLALLGWNPGNEEEIFDLKNLIEKFDLSKVQKKSAVFDHKKFNWVSAQHLLNQDNKDILNHLIKIDNRWKSESHNDSFKQLIELVKPRSNSLLDLIEQSEYFFSAPNKFNESDLKKIWEEDTCQIMKDIIVIFESVDNWIVDKIEDKFKEFVSQNGLEFGKAMKPLRFSLCGNLKGPSLFDLMQILGKKESLNRINYAIHKLCNQ